MSRVLAIDAGTKRLGLAIGAVGEPLRGRGTIAAQSAWETTIGQLIESEAVGAIVVGLPRRSSGRPSASGRAALEVARRAAVFGLPVWTINEAYSSVEAERQLRLEGVATEKDKAAVDERAACLILDQWLHR